MQRTGQKLRVQPVCPARVDDGLSLVRSPLLDAPARRLAVRRLVEDREPHVIDRPGVGVGHHEVPAELPVEPLARRRGRQPVARKNPPGEAVQQFNIRIPTPGCQLVRRGADQHRTDLDGAFAPG